MKALRGFLLPTKLGLAGFWGTVVLSFTLSTMGPQTLPTPHQNTEPVQHPHRGRCHCGVALGRAHLSQKFALVETQSKHAIDCLPFQETVHKLGDLGNGLLATHGFKFHSSNCSGENSTTKPDDVHVIKECKKKPSRSAISPALLWPCATQLRPKKSMTGSPIPEL